MPAAIPLLIALFLSPQELPASRDVAPRVTREVKPDYPESVRAAGVEGIVTLRCVVRADGTVGEARVVKSLHPVLDQEALRVIDGWQFVPGRKDGKPVAAEVDVEMVFSWQTPPEPFSGPTLDSPEVLSPGVNGVTVPRVVKEVRPSYSWDALKAGAQGAVKLECVVLPDGTVGEVRIARSLHSGLDSAAARALRQWTFKPAVKDGIAVPVRVEVEMTFTLGYKLRK